MRRQIEQLADCLLATAIALTLTYFALEYFA